jgi:hypothetical protein
MWQADEEIEREDIEFAALVMTFSLLSTNELFVGVFLSSFSLRMTTLEKFYLVSSDVRLARVSPSSQKLSYFWHL